MPENILKLIISIISSSASLYECEVGNKPKYLKSWKVGRVPFGSPSRIPDFTSLGDIAVDFDFATPTLRRPELFIGKDINKV